MRELVGVYEQWDSSASEFLRSVIIWKDGDDFHRTSLPIRQSGITATTLDSLPPNDSIPREHYCGPWNDAFTKAPNPLPPNSFLKRRSLILYDGTPSVGGQLVIEAHVLEKLAKNPHPNIVTYYGCVREGDLLSAICIKRYPTTLDDERQSLCLSPTRQRLILDGLKAGIAHLHEIGLVHNDLKPDNIMLDDDGIPVIIDFDICRKEGDICAPGTPGWSRPRAGSEPCTRENDLYALGLIKRWMEGEDGTTPIIIDFDCSTMEGVSCDPGIPGWGRPRAGRELCTKQNDLYALGLIKRYMEGDYDETDYRLEEME